MKKFLLFLCAGSFFSAAFGQHNFWNSHEGYNQITTDIGVARMSFPKDFKLFDLNPEPLRQELFSITDRAGQSTVITLPNADGSYEQFEIFEASNFEPVLQARFPEIRAFSGRGITDRHATLKLSISPQGIQIMIFRTDKENEFIEPYSNDHLIYSVFKSQRGKGKLPWTCSTDDKKMFSDIKSDIQHTNNPQSNAGQLKTIRLAQSCTGEYANFFGAFNSSQVGLVLTAYNNTLTRCNGVYEKDLALHLNLIANTTAVIFYDPVTDPYATVSNPNSPPASWNSSLQSTLTSIIGETNYDIGHLFGASGGGGNAGCIGCVCVDGQKGSGITSPATGSVNPSPSFPPSGDGFDIDYVAHEVGHQLGAYHTFSHVLEGSGVNKEVGAGITIMGYAGITNYDPAPHSIDIFHEASIDQIQVNLAGKTCPITTVMTANHPPVVAPVSNYTIPVSTPFALTGSATDPEGDPITYCWEQNDNSTTTGNNSVAFPAKITGPNWLSFPATASPTRLCPGLSTILAGLFITPALPGGDAICNIEALSSVSRILNFRLTVRDNRPYITGSTIGQTQFADMAVTVTNTSGPFQVTSPNTNLTWVGGTTQTITWNVAGTAGAPVSCANVKISLSTDGGITFLTVLAASTPNDGSEALSIPSSTTFTARIKIEAVGNIFFDISDADFIISTIPFGFLFNAPLPVSSGCPALATLTSTINVIGIGGYVNPVTLSATGNPVGTSVSFSPNPVTPSVGPGTPVTITFSGTNALAFANYDITVNGTGTSAANQSQIVRFTINPGAAPVITTQPQAQSVCQGSAVNLNVAATGTNLSYQWQISTNGGGAWNNISGATTTSFSIPNAPLSGAGQYRCVVTGQCGITNSNGAILTVLQLPTVSLSSSKANLLPGQISTLTAVPSSTTGGIVTTSWLYNGAAPTPPISGNTYNADVEHAGTYQLTIQETFSGPGLVCSNQSAVVTITATASDKLFIFSSPNSGNFIVSYYNNGGASTRRTIVIFDSKGSMVLNSQFNITGAYTLIPINLKTANGGIYYVNVGDMNGKKLATGKVNVK